MKKKRFYNDKKRNQKWTEEEVGKKIDFADKYDEQYHSNTDYSKSDEQKKKKKKKNNGYKTFTSVILCILAVCVGYIGMDIHLNRVNEPVENLINNNNVTQKAVNNMEIDAASCFIDSISLDSSVMLSSVVKEVTNNGFTSVTFDVKRSDGTIGYKSSLAAIDTYSAISSAATQPKASVKELTANDILPIARICCYQDDILPIKAEEYAIKNGEKLYEDSNGNTYLNPDLEITFNYIRDIVNECSSFGITVFVLQGCDLPSEISNQYSDGFKILSQKLTKEVGTNVKFLEQVDISLSNDNETELNAQIKKMKKLNSNQIYCISCEFDQKKLVNKLTKNGIKNYIITTE